MKTKSTIVMFIIMILLGLYYFIFEHISDDSSRNWKVIPNEILSFGKQDVEKILFVSSQRDTIVVERINGNWFVTHPLHTLASSSTIEFLMKQAVPGQKVSEIPGVKDMGKFGLDNPVGVLVLWTDKDKEGDTIYVGNKTPTRTNCYIRINSSDTVYISREIRQDVMNKSLYHFRDKHLFDLEASNIDSIMVVKGKNQIILRRKGSEWVISENGKYPREEIIHTLGEILNALIYEFAAEDTSNLESFGLAMPDYYVVFYTNQRQIRLDFGDIEDDLVYVTNNQLGKVVKINANCMDLFEYISDSY